jgi:hypothetical protein
MTFKVKRKGRMPKGYRININRYEGVGMTPNVESYKKAKKVFRL